MELFLLKDTLSALSPSTELIIDPDADYSDPEGVRGFLLPAETDL